MSKDVFLDFTHIKENGDHSEAEWNEMIQEMFSEKRPFLKIDKSIYIRFLEILPPVYLNSSGFGFVEGDDYIVDFWHAGTFYFCRRSSRKSLNQVW